MVFSRKFIGANELEVVTQPAFEEKIRSYPIEVHSDIIENILYSIDLFYDDDLVQYIGGVCNVVPPVFYVIEYYHEEGFYTSILDFHEIECDEYLDLINEEKTIESYEIKE
jgi:hypothetical protein